MSYTQCKVRNVLHKLWTDDRDEVWLLYTFIISIFFFFFATESSVCFSFISVPKLVFLVGCSPFLKLLPFVAWAWSPPTHQFPYYLAYWLCLLFSLCFPPCLVENLVPVPLLSKAGEGRGCVRAVILLLEGGKAQNGPATHCPPPPHLPQG